MKRNISYILLVSLLLSLAFSGCKKDDKVEDTAGPAGKLVINFEHYLNNAPVLVDTFAYTNAAGNVYNFYLVRYFISDVILYHSDGTQRKIKDWTDYFYIDTEYPYTLKWEVYDELAVGDYDSLSFHFGFKDEDNISFMFSNQPESNMVWPEYDGGGYHYLQLEGKWINPNNIKIGYAFHLGRGQHYDSNGHPIPPFIDNSFRVSLPASSFSIAEGQSTEITLRMNIEQWFENPHVYDHNQWGGDIMEQQDAMILGVENGWNVFSFHK